MELLTRDNVAKLTANANNCNCHGQLYKLYTHGQDNSSFFLIECKLL